VGWRLHLRTGLINYSNVAPFWNQYQGETVPGEQRMDYWGDTWWVLVTEISDEKGPIYWADEKGSIRIRDVMPVYEWTACSVAPGRWATTPSGLEIFPGFNKSDIVDFLLLEGFFEGEDYPGDAAIDWVQEHTVPGPLLVGDLMPLPPLP
jgi:hypothetical protein